jgi:hypothetical protein
MDALQKRGFAHLHHRIAWDSVWAQFSRRQHNSNASGHNNGKRASDRSSNGNGNGNTGNGNTGNGNGNNNRNDNIGSGNGNGNGNGNTGNGNGSGNGNGNSGGSKSSGSGSDTCPFGGSFPNCFPDPQSGDTTTAAKQAGSPTATTPSVEQTTPAQSQPPDTSVAGAPSTAAQSATSTGGSDPSNTSSAAATGSQSTPLDSQPTSSGQAGQVSGSLTSGQASTSLNPLGLPFGADPSATSAGGLGVGQNNTAASGSGSVKSATSTGTDVGAIAGGVIGTISLVLLLLFGLWLIRRRQKNRTAPSAEFLTTSRHPLTGSAQFQFRRIEDSNYDTQSQNNLPPPISPHARVDTPRSFLHMREKSEP